MPTLNDYPPKLQFAGHETFSLRQLWLRKGYSAVVDFDPASSDAKNAFADEAAISRFGVGKNMVSSIRHWALACDVLREARGSSLEAGDIGNALFAERGGLDPFMERPATAWLIHWMLAGRAARSSTWYWVFNRVTQQTFSRSSLQAGLQQFAEQRGQRVAPITVKRDIEVCVRCYLARRDTREVDDSAEPLLADLGLLVEGPGDVLQFRRGQQPSLPGGVFAYALLDFWQIWEDLTDSRQRTLSFEAIAHEYASPGRVFKLDENAVAERVVNLEELTHGALKWSDTAGIRQVARDPDVDMSKLKQKVLRGAYGR